MLFEKLARVSSNNVHISRTSTRNVRLWSIQIENVRRQRKILCLIKIDSSAKNILLANGKETRFSYSLSCSAERLNKTATENPLSHRFPDCVRGRCFLRALSLARITNIPAEQIIAQRRNGRPPSSFSFPPSAGHLLHSWHCLSVRLTGMRIDNRPFTWNNNRALR